MKCPRCDKPINDGESYCPHCGYKLEKKKSRTWIMIGGVVLAGVVLGSYVFGALYILSNYIPYTHSH